MHRILEADLRAIAPFGNPSILRGLARHAGDLLPRYGIDTPARIAHFLAQAAHETGGFNTLTEYGDEAYFRQRYGSRRDLGNLSARDGALYRGRGIFQLTGRANYRRYGEKIDVPLEAKPELAADPGISLLIACEYWQAHRLNDLADKGKFEAITRAINGGRNGLQDRRRCLARAWARFGEGPLPAVETDPDRLETGDSGRQVLALQQRLGELGYPVGAVDGHFGALTRRALVAFQSDNGLVADGIAGPATLQALDAAEALAPLPRAEASVAELKQKGSTTIAAADAIKAVAAVTAAAGAVQGGEATGAVDAVSGLAGSADQLKSVLAPVSEVRELLTPLIDTFHWLSSSLWIALIAGGVLIWIYAGRIIAARVTDHASGKHLGR